MEAMPRFDARNLTFRVLEENTFGDASFRKIVLESTRITTIHDKAFTFTNLFTRELIINRSELGGTNAVVKGPFDVFAKFPFLEHLSVNFGKLTAIPNDAFSSPSNGAQNYLIAVSFRGNLISYVGNKAFAALPALRKLDLRENKYVNQFVLTRHDAIVSFIQIDGNQCTSVRVRPTIGETADHPPVQQYADRVQHSANGLSCHQATDSIRTGQQ